MWNDPYYNLLNSKGDGDGYTSNQPYAIDKLKIGKPGGSDSVRGANFKYGHSKVTSLLSMLLNVMFLHNYLPSTFMETSIVRIIKNKKCLITDKDN